MLWFILWFGAMLLLRLTPLTGSVFLLASVGLTSLLSALGWAIMAIWIRLRPDGGR